MKLQMRKRAGVVAASALAAGLVFGGVAIAAWVANGTGSGTSKAITATALTTTDASLNATSELYPGGFGALNITINNPNPYPVKVTDIVSNGTVTATGGIGTCTVTGVSLAPITGAADFVAANSSASFTHFGVVSMNNTSDNGCQGATFTIPVALTGVSNA